MPCLLLRNFRFKASKKQRTGKATVKLLRSIDEQLVIDPNRSTERIEKEKKLKADLTEITLNNGFSQCWDNELPPGRIHTFFMTSAWRYCPLYDLFQWKFVETLLDSDLDDLMLLIAEEPRYKVERQLMKLLQNNLSIYSDEEVGNYWLEANNACDVKEAGFRFNILRKSFEADIYQFVRSLTNVELVSFSKYVTEKVNEYSR